MSNKLDEINTRLIPLQPDIIVCTESWLSDSVPNSSIFIDNFCVERADRDIHGGGVVVYFKPELELHKVSFVPAQLKSDILCLHSSLCKLVIIAVYHPYWNNPDAHCTLMSSLLDMLLHYDDSITKIVTGDFNDFRHISDHFSQSSGLSQVIHVPTRGQNIIDLFFTNRPHHFYPAIQAPLGLSDHVVIVIKPLVVASSPIVRKSVRELLPSNFARFEEFLATNNVFDVFLSCTPRSPTEVDTLVFNFTKCLYALYNHFFPITLVRCRKIEPPWVNDKIRLLVHKKCVAFRKKQMGKYLSIRDSLNKEIKLAVRNFYQHRFANSPSNKSMWKSIQQVAKCKTPSRSLSLSDALNLNQQFANTFEPRISSDVLESDNLHGPVLDSHTCFKYLLDIRKSTPGPDGLPGNIFKTYALYFVDITTFIFNNCLKFNFFPSLWKKAHIVPVPKNTTEFRPISLLCCLSKVYEKIVLYEWFLPSLKSNFNPAQFGFLPKHFTGCSLALTKLRHLCLQWYDEGDDVTLVAIDLKKAFDKVSHDVLLRKSPKFLSTAQTSWLCNFLTSRYQKVFFADNPNSIPWVSVTSGVPQGSIMGPFAFCLMMDDCNPVSINTEIIMYADDITLIHRSRNNLTNLMQTELTSITTWASSNKLFINEAKCFSMFFSRNQTPPSLYINNTCLPICTTAKILGMHISSNFSVTTHMSKAFAKAYSGLYAVRRLRQLGAPVHVVRAAFYAFVFSHIAFGWPAIANLNAHYSRMLQHIQRQLFALCNDSSKLSGKLNKICVRLATQIRKNPHHPLRCCFQTRSSFENHNLRSYSTFLPIFTRSTRFKNSFTKFAIV